MKPNILLRLGSLALALTPAVWASGFFGTVVPIGGHASDIALDEGRGVLYIANYTANRVEVMNTSDRSIGTSINVPLPGSLALSRDGKYLVVGTYSNFQAPNGQPSNVVTIIALDTNVRRTVSVNAPPLAVGFGADGLALVVTATEFLILDPVSAATVSLGPIKTVLSQVLPATAPVFPPQILTASLGVSGDGQLMYGITNDVEFAYSVQDQAIFQGSYVASPTLGPRLVSVNNDGSMFVAGWSVYTSKLGQFAYQFNDATGVLNIGSHAIDSVAGRIYAQVPSLLEGAVPAAPTSTTQCLPNGTCVTITIPPPAGTPPATAAVPAHLTVLDADNLTIRNRMLISENLAGRSILNGARDTLYSISDSGVTVFPVGALNNQPQVSANQEDLVFLGAFCNRQTLTQNITINGPAGTPFQLSLVDPSVRGVSFSATSGVTPATVRVTVDPSSYQSLNGTTTVYVRVDSDTAENLQPATCPVPAGTGPFPNACFRLLINNPNPDQRGTVVNVPGLLVDLLADPTRNRFYILRQDTNQVLVFDASNNSQIAALRTGTTPMQMAISPDGQYLLVGHNNAQFISVFDLDSMQPSQAILMPGGHYPRSIAVSGRAILVASRVAGPTHMISQVDFDSRTATPLPSLGPFTNSINQDTVLVATPHGAFIMAAMPDGTLMLYDASADTFTIARKDYPALSGAYAASDTGQFAIDNNILNQSLSRIAVLDKGQGGTSGFAFAGPTVFRTTGPVAAGTTAGAAGGALNTPGLIERVDLTNPNKPLSTRTVEAPLFPSIGGGSGAASGTVIAGATAFIRSLVALPNGTLISLTQSGFTVLPLNFDATTAKPVVTSVVNGTDPKQPITTLGLIDILGSNLAAATVTSNANPAPTVLGNSCVTVNGGVIPLFKVSQPEIDAQLPASVGSSGTLIVYTPGGISDPFTFTAQPTAPSVLPSVPGGDTPAIYRMANGLLVTPTNPIHKNDDLFILAGGLGQTDPQVDAGSPSPSNPIALVTAKPIVELNGVNCTVVRAFLVPGKIGVYEIDVKVPTGVTQGPLIPLKITQGGSSVTVLVRVVD